MDSEYHQYLITIIESDKIVKNRKRAAKILGSKVIVPYIKTKKYRKFLTAFIDKLRVSKNFRDRQIYLQLAKSSYKAEPDVFKKHFAKAIGNDMLNEKVVVV
jgi:hypothetical protein